MSKYLVNPTTEAPSGAGHKSLPRSRLLTGAESLAMLEVKERKKQDERKKRRNERKKEKRKRNRKRPRRKGKQRNKQKGRGKG